MACTEAGCGCSGGGACSCGGACAGQLSPPEHVLRPMGGVLRAEGGLPVDYGAEPTVAGYPAPPIPDIRWSPECGVIYTPP